MTMRVNGDNCVNDPIFQSIYNNSSNLSIATVVLHVSVTGAQQTRAVVSKLYTHRQFFIIFGHSPILRGPLSCSTDISFIFSFQLFKETRFKGPRY